MEKLDFLLKNKKISFNKILNYIKNYSFSVYIPENNIFILGLMKKTLKKY